MSGHDAPLDAPADRFCDIVMEGGITSGIIYASAVAELARHYRFASIGGSSIGAFAAALTAAAEFRRRKGHADGFAVLARLPTTLAEKEDGDRRTLLERLFVPQEDTRRLFRIFLAMLERSGPASVLCHGVREAIRQYERRVMVCAVVLAVVAAPGLAGMLLGGVVGAVLALLFGIASDFARHVVPNGFGLCRGWQEGANNDRLDLAAFLHKSIQEVAGRRTDEAPLTFRDLWDAPGSPGQVFGLTGAGAARSIKLEVYASNLSHGRPYRFPLEETDDMGRLFFRIDELERYFPKGIVQFIASHATPYEPVTDSDPQDVGSGYLQLPSADLPVVVAARLAMSFPILISAVPLHAVDHTEQRMARCWMSDGGLCSNFPIHLFDSFLPKWPTFGISLNSLGEAGNRRVWLPEYHTSGRADTWNHGPDRSSWKLASFLASLWKTAWRWNDSTMMRMPGVRDRVVRVYLAEGEGGVNIRMGARTIRELGERYGQAAAKAFIRKFALPGSVGWEEHRWVRLNCLLVSLRERIRNFEIASRVDRHTTLLEEQLQSASNGPALRQASRGAKPDASEKPLDPQQALEVSHLVAALCALEQAFKDAGDTRPYQPQPRPSLRIRHPT